MWYRRLLAKVLPPFVQALKQQLTNGPMNLCEPPANFCPANLNIERSEMPQFDSEEGEQWMQELAKKGIPITVEYVPVGELKASQNDINGFTLAKSLKDLDNPIHEPTFVNQHPIIAAADNYILDGHHRWGGLLIWSWLVQGDDKAPAKTIRIGLPFQQLIMDANYSPYSERVDINNRHLPRKDELPSPPEATGAPVSAPAV